MPNHETIGPAAIRCRGEIFTGQSHLEAYEKLRRILPDVPDDELTECDGFLTSTGRYVCRKDALVIAAAAIQLTGNQPESTTKLRSEYLIK